MSKKIERIALERKIEALLDDDFSIYGGTEEQSRIQQIKQEKLDNYTQINEIRK